MACPSGWMEAALRRGSVGETHDCPTTFTSRARGITGEIRAEDGSSGSAFQFRDLNRIHDFNNEARASQFVTAHSRATSYQPVVPRADVRPRQFAATSLSPGQHFTSVNQDRSLINQRAFNPIAEEVLSGLTVGESYAFNTKMLGQHIASRGPPPGLEPRLRLRNL